MFGNFSFQLLFSIGTFVILTIIINGGVRGYIKSLLKALNNLKNNREYQVYFWGILLLLFFDTLELRGENYFSTTYLYSYFIAKIEAPFIIKLQSFSPVWLIFLASYVYVFLFPVLFIAIFYYGLLYKKRPLIAGLFYIYLINYLVAFPFYVNLPVYEAWVVHPGIKLLVNKFYPEFNFQYRNFSGINNNFPSLHTALSVSFFYLTLVLKEKKLALVLGISSFLIVFATVYLGIHWFVDIIAGIFLGVGVVYFYTYRMEEQELLDKFYKKLAFSFLAVVFFIGGLVHGAPHAQKYYGYLKKDIGYLEIQKKTTVKIKNFYKVLKDEIKEISGGI